MAASGENRTGERRIRAMADRGALPHAMILSGPGDRLGVARYAAAARECTAPSGRPCGICQQCRKVREDIHPDVIWAQDTAHRDLPVDTVRELRKEVYIRPNDAERKVIIFPDCDQLNERDQNVLLKIVEEGPAYAAFIFCTELADRLLPTIRSRCVELKLPLEEGQSEPDLTLCRAFATGQFLPVAEETVALENRKIKREDLQNLLRDTWRVSAEALLYQSGKAASEEVPAEAVTALAQALSPRQLKRLTAFLKHYTDECHYNVGAGHVLGALAAEWEKTL